MSFDFCNCSRILLIVFVVFNPEEKKQTNILFKVLIFMSFPVSVFSLLLQHTTLCKLFGSKAAGRLH